MKIYFKLLYRHKHEFDLISFISFDGLISNMFYSHSGELFVFNCDKYRWNFKRLKYLKER